MSNINDIKTVEELEAHTFRSVVDVIQRFYDQQLQRFGHDARSDVFLAIHMGAFNAIVGSMCKEVLLPPDVSAKIVTNHWNLIEDEILGYEGK